MLPGPGGIVKRAVIPGLGLTLKAKKYYKYQENGGSLMVIKRSAGALSLIAFLLLIATPAMAEVPPLFEGEIGVCNAVERDRLQGETMKDALKSLVNSMQTNDPEILGSMRRTIIHNAIRICKYDPAIVIAAVYEADLPLDLIIGAGVGAKVGKAVIVNTLVDLGVQPEAIASVLDQIRAPETVDFYLPPPFVAGSGLGQASSFIP